MIYLFFAVLGFIFIFSVFGTRAGFFSLALFIAGFILWQFDLWDSTFNFISGFFSSLLHVLESIYSYLDQLLI
jgi:hypothetical protein